MTDVSERLRAALSDRYRIERELGAGGMATVYLAQDLKHDRKVAIKVLRPELATAIGPDRFLREIKITAQLHHPHILELYDSGTADEFLYYVMPFVEGESLRSRLDREKQLPLDDALRIAREVADALSYAHAHGVIHRDIKPENILLQSGHAVVADFGIARAIDAAGGMQLTETGLSIGTPTYMSPEQAAGERDLDGRSDLYALACVLYEMLAGQPPFTGPTADAIVRQHLTVDAPPVTNLRPAVPPAVASALQRALAKTPADRFNPVAQFSDALYTGSAAGPDVAGRTRSSVNGPVRLSRTAAVTGLLAILAVAAVAVWVTRRPHATRTPSVAVLPFVDLSPDHKDEYLGDGIAETLSGALANVPGLDVAARTSAFSFKGRNEDVREIGRQLGVATVLEGSVQQVGDRLRVMAQLVNTSDGLHLWSQTFDRTTGDIFAVQDEVARAVVSALQGKLLGEQVRIGTGEATRNRTAYDLYLQGRFFWNKRDVPDLLQAIEYFREAIAQDSSYAQAWAGLADAYITLPFYSDTIRSADAVPRARQAAEHALTLNPNLAEAHTTLAYALTIYDWSWDAAEREFRRAMELDPTYATAPKWYSDLLTAMGRPEEALAAARRAVELDPRSPNARTILGTSHWILGRTDSVRANIEQALAMDPTFPLALMHGSWLYWVIGDTARFFTLHERLNTVSEQGDVSTATLRAAYAAGGPDSVMRLEVTGPTARRNPMARARWHVLLGNLDAAFADLDEAARDRAAWLPFEIRYPYMASLRADPRYAAFKKRIGLKS